MTAPLLAVEHLTKRFRGATALEDVSLELRSGEVVGLIGQNGSGKSTLLKCLVGIHQPDGGRLVFRGEPTRIRGVADAGARGVGIVFQEQSLLPNLSVAENIMLGKPSASTRGGFYRWGRLRREAERHLAKIESTIAPGALVSDLSFGQRQMVELAKVLALEELVDGELVILFDEPTSVLSAPEIQQLFRQVQRLRSRACVVFVSHRLDEVLEVSDRVCVLQDGRCVAERMAAGTHPKDLYHLMVGSERAEDYYLQSERAEATSDSPLLEVERLGSHGRFSDVSFELARGQVLGLAGVVGSGREALCRALFGAVPITSGTVTLEGRRLRLRSPGDAVRAGLGFVPSERDTEGIVRGRSVHENMVLAYDRQLASGPLLSRSAERRAVEDWMTQLRVKAPGPDTRIEQLSGGNAQKVALGKWLLGRDLRVLVLDHPTRGLDLGAKGDLYGIIRRLAGEGLAILLMSDTLEETLGLSDEVIVMRDGEVSGRFDTHHDPPSSQQLVELMV